MEGMYWGDMRESGVQDEVVHITWALAYGSLAGWTVTESSVGIDGAWTGVAGMYEL